MPHAYTEDQLVEQPAIHLFAELGWSTVSAMEEVLGTGGTLQRETTGDVVLASPLIALSVPDRFTHHIFCEKEGSLLRALEIRARAIAPEAFLATEYVNAMAKLGYLTTSTNQMMEVRSTDRNLPLYYLAFFSKSEQGYKFWRDVQKYSTNQLGLPLV